VVRIAVTLAMDAAIVLATPESTLAVQRLVEADVARALVLPWWRVNAYAAAAGSVRVSLEVSPESRNVGKLEVDAAIRIGEAPVMPALVRERVG
jgi:hypothetical protein